MATSQSLGSAKVIPAQLSFLAIYNPAFGDTDETAHEQIFYYYSKDDHHKDAPGNEPFGEQSETAGKTTEEEQNERLRQVGVARGIVEFANNFSNGIPVDFVESEKSRIVLHELERGWWILASIDLTRLPAAARSALKDEREGSQIDQHVEYSAREVSPPRLLLTHLRQAHARFLLHHAADLNELLQKLNRPLFTEALHRYWDKFASDWDVLLHGNPATDICDAIKLAGGGELGIGVGEEEWGSGEREVLEDFVERTEGLVDLLVGRYGDAPPDGSSSSAPKSKSLQQLWLGCDYAPRASDGIVFSGIGKLSRRSVATVSQWMDAIFSQGSQAYGVGDNPSARQRQRRQGAASSKSRDQSRTAGKDTNERIRSTAMAGQRKSEDKRHQAFKNATALHGIPAPLVSSVERSLDKAVTDKAGTATSTKSGEGSATSPDDEASYFDPEKMMNFLKLGYGSSWTLNPKGFSKEQAAQDNNHPETPTSSSMDVESKSELQVIDPNPELSDEDTEQTFVQHLEQSIGRFIIGLTGDLENTEFDAESPEDAQLEAVDRRSKRIHLRTLTVQMSPSHIWQREQPDSSFEPYRHAKSTAPSESAQYQGSKTSAAASVDGSVPSAVSERVRVVVYVHQPFIFTFIFDLHTPNLVIPAFYRNIHHQLGPLQKPLLRSTDPLRIPQRVLEHLGASKDTDAHLGGLYDMLHDPTKLTVRTSIPNIPLPGTLAAEGIVKANALASSKRMVSGAWYTLGIPIGSESLPASSTSATDPGDSLLRTDWTRLEALNVHGQILNTWIATRTPGTDEIDLGGDFEQTIKTARGWWVVWMRIPHAIASTPGTRPTSSATMKLWRDNVIESRPREAFLVRKSMDPASRVKDASAQSSTSGRWLLRDQTRDASGSTASGQADAPTSARGVIEGVGVDARRWVEGLSKLTQ